MQIPIPESPIPLTSAAPRIALIAGEASGDLLGASLAADLRARYPDAQIVGVAGPRMRAEGVESWFDCEQLAVMGLVEVLRHLPRLLRLRRTLRQRLLDWKPDLVVGIDAPDFNLGLERWLKQRGVRTAHYVSPSVWAWREQRAGKLGESADRVLCLFPIEPPIYARYGVAAEFVGHPLARQFPLAPERDAARRMLGITDRDGPWLAVLPGSRVGEIRRLAAPFLHAAALLRRRHPQFRLLLPTASARSRAAFDEALRATLAAAPGDASERLASQQELLQLHERLHVVDGQSHAVLQAADLVLLASGTAALEAMLAKQPMVVGYRIAGLTHFLVKALGMLKVDRYSLPNVLAGERLVAECMQHDCTSPVLAQHLVALWEDTAARDALLPRYRQLHEALLPPRPAAAAEALVPLLAP